ncbi:MAG: hypothetical protein IJY46_07785 [Lentisphaeria bacterium]|nr:hypothetical protein [Lentisphaeria bacterium]
MSDEQKTILGGSDNDTQAETTITDVPENSGGDDNSQDSSGSSFDFSVSIDKDGFFADNWKDGLPEDLRNEPSLAGVKNLTTLAKSYVNAQKMVGKNRIALPGENATPEERNAFYTALGRPAAAADYKHDSIEVPEGFQLDDKALSAFRDTAFELGLTQEGFEKALAFDLARTKQAAEAALARHNAEYDATMNKLQQQYGDNLPARIAQVDKALSTFGIKDLFIERGLTNNYQIFEALAKIGASISESKLKDGDVQQNFKTPQQQIEEIYADPNGAIYNSEHPGHDKAVAEVKRLMALANKS